MRQSSLPPKFTLSLPLRPLSRRRYSALPDLLDSAAALPPTPGAEPELGRRMKAAAHDLNNLLSAILGAAQLVESRLDPEHPARPMAALIGKAARRGQGLTRAVLDSGPSDPAAESRARFDLGTLILEVLDCFSVVVPPNVKVQVQVEPGVWVVGNSDQLHQVLMNILTNACDVVRTGGGRVAVDLGTERWDRAESGLPPGTYAVVSIRDSGPGMEPAVLAKIFNPYFTTHQGRGRGLGLAIARKMVDLHGGTIQVASQRGQGTEFRIVLPLQGWA